MMAIPTIVTGMILTGIGSFAYLNATPNAEGKVSPTALIPAIIGLLILICGAIALKDSLRKHAMHFAAMLGVLGFLGGFAPPIRQLATGKDLNLAAPAAVAGLSMALVCACFVTMCVRSFIAARKSRQAREAGAA
jgi:ascorbate-specific PTS system EIIC-type component UlaA